MKLTACRKKKIFLKENVFSGQTYSPESNFDIQRIEIL